MDTSVRELIDGFRSHGWSITDIHEDDYLLLVRDVAAPQDGIRLPLNPDLPEYASSMDEARAHLNVLELLTPEREGEPTVLPGTSVTVDDARRQLTDLRLSYSSLSERERDILDTAEALLRLLNEESDYGARF